MMTEKMFVLPLDDELAAAYEVAAEGEREKVETVMNLLLRQMLLPNRRNLMHIMDAMSDQAEANGLTGEILDQLLRDDE